MPPIDPTPLWFTLMGTLGGAAYILVWKITEKYEIIRHLLLGAIIGLIYYSIYSEWTFPNSVMAFISGYMGTDFLEGLAERTKPIRKALRRYY